MEVGALTTSGTRGIQIGAVPRPCPVFLQSLQGWVFMPLLVRRLVLGGYRNTGCLVVVCFLFPVAACSWHARLVFPFQWRSTRIRKDV